MRLGGMRKGREIGQAKLGMALGIGQTQIGRPRRWLDRRKGSRLCTMQRAVVPGIPGSKYETRGDPAAAIRKQTGSDPALGDSQYLLQPWHLSHCPQQRAEQTVTLWSC